MSTLKTDSLGNLNFIGNLKAGDGFVRREYYEQATTPETSTDSAVWYDTTNDQIKILINGTWSIFSSSVYVPPLGGDTATIAGGFNTNTIDTYSIPTTGNATDFGDLLSSRFDHGGAGGGGRGIFAGGYVTNQIQYITFATAGNAIDFGDLVVSAFGCGGVCNNTNALFAGGSNNYSNPSSFNTINYITVATPGNATDFGDLTVARRGAAGVSSPTRGIWAGGQATNSAATSTNVIDYVTIATAGNAVDFGDLLNTSGNLQNAGAANSTRGLIFGTPTTTIQYITTATTGNAADFGDLLDSSLYYTAACNNSTRCTANGGRVGSSDSNVIQYITIDTLGNATDFGDLTAARRALAAAAGN